MIYSDKFIFHLPYFRIQQRIGQMGVPIPTSTFESWVKLGAQHIKPLFAVHRLYVFSEIYQQIDESPIKVQDKDKPGTLHQGYMWVRYAPVSKSVLFEYYKGRSPNEPLRDLSKFKDYIQTDGYAGYTHLAETSCIIHLSCWAHARRYFDKPLANDQPRASKVLKLIQLLYAIEALAREADMTHEQRYALRLEKSLPIINEIGSYIYNERSRVLPKSPIGAAFEYCANRWISLQNYLKDGMLEIDSNLIENSIRLLAARTTSLPVIMKQLKTLPCFTVSSALVKGMISIPRNGLPMSSTTSTTPKPLNSKDRSLNLLIKICLSD